MYFSQLLTSSGSIRLLDNLRYNMCFSHWFERRYIPWTLTPSKSCTSHLSVFYNQLILVISVFSEVRRWFDRRYNELLHLLRAVFWFFVGHLSSHFSVLDYFVNRKRFSLQKQGLFMQTLTQKQGLYLPLSQIQSRKRRKLGLRECIWHLADQHSHTESPADHARKAYAETAKESDIEFKPLLNQPILSDDRRIDTSIVIDIHLIQVRLAYHFCKCRW